MGYLLCNDHHHGYVKFHCISVQPWQRDGNHNLVKWPKDVSLGYLVRERFVCKEEAELMFSVPTPKGFLDMFIPGWWILATFTSPQSLGHLAKCVTYEHKRQGQWLS